MPEEKEKTQLLEVCWWCGEDWPIGAPICGNCGNSVRKKPKINWDLIGEIFPDGMPSCGLTDAAQLGGSDADAPVSGTIYLNK